MHRTRRLPSGYNLNTLGAGSVICVVSFYMKSIIAKTLLGMLCCSQLCMSRTHAQAPGVSAEAILQRMADAYSSLSSYSDSGTVHHCDKSRPDNTSFRIYFVRPACIRFEMTNNVGSPYFPQDYKVLWSDGTQTSEWWQSIPQIRTNRDTLTGIKGFTGISSRAVHNVPSLLQTNFGWQEYLSEISSPTLLGDESVEKIDCYHVQGEGKAKRRFELWIGKADYLIRKVRTTHDPDFCEEEVQQNIRLNEQISSNMFVFTPMKAGEIHAKN